MLNPPLTISGSWHSDPASLKAAWSDFLVRPMRTIGKLGPQSGSHGTIDWQTVAVEIAAFPDPGDGSTWEWVQWDHEGSWVSTYVCKGNTAAIAKYRDNLVEFRTRYPQARRVMPYGMPTQYNGATQSAFSLWGARMDALRPLWSNDAANAITGSLYNPYNQSIVTAQAMSLAYDTNDDGTPDRRLPCMVNITHRYHPSDGAKAFRSYPDDVLQQHLRACLVSGIDGFATYSADWYYGRSAYAKTSSGAWQQVGSTWDRWRYGVLPEELTNDEMLAVQQATTTEQVRLAMEPWLDRTHRRVYQMCLDCYVERGMVIP